MAGLVVVLTACQHASPAPACGSGSNCSDRNQLPAPVSIQTTAPLDPQLALTQKQPQAAEPAATEGSFFIHYPPQPRTTSPLQVLVVLHGFRDRGTDFARPFIPMTDANGWVLVAPTFTYHDWWIPKSVRADDLNFSRQLSALLIQLESSSPYAIRAEALVCGFSRGAQLADRFAMFHPEQVAAVVSLSAGTYTLPEPSGDLDGDGKPDVLPLPFGTADMNRWFGHSLDLAAIQRIHFLVGVGSEDNNPNDLPRQWDSLLGRTRVARARGFEHALRVAGVTTQLQIFPGVRHQLTVAMVQSAISFFQASA